MHRVASLFLPHLPIERLRGIERTDAPPDAHSRAQLPIDDDPGACSVPRGGGWRPGARWAQDRGEVAERIASMPAHQRPPVRELGRRSEAAQHPFRGSRSEGPPRAPGAPGPTLRAEASRPLVLAAKAARREVVSAASRAALALGVGVGTPLTQARALIPELEVLPAEPALDAAFLDRLALHAARHWAPTAAPSGNDGIWIDLTGAAHLHGGEEAFCRRVVRFLARLGFTARVAVADTPGCAHAAARHVARAWTVVPRGGAVPVMAPLPVEALRFEEAALVACRRFGIERVADLLPMPRAPLARRLGRAAVERLDQAIGRTPEPIVPVVVEDAPACERRLLEPIGTPEAIGQVIGDLLEDLVVVLRERGLGARSLVLTFERVDALEQRLTIGTSRPTRDAAHLARLLVLRMDRVEPGLGIETARLVASRTEPLGAESLAAALDSDSRTSDVAALVDRLVGRAGERAVFRVSSVESDVPERAVRKVPPLNEVVGWPEWPRPVRMLRRPEPLENVLALLPDHPPRRFVWRGRVHEIVAGDGPERVHGEWWVRSGEMSAVRDYFRVEDREGVRLWVFRRGDGDEPNTGDLSWWVHGLFG